MSILVRRKQDAWAEDYFDELVRVEGCIPANHAMAIELRM